jgi:hypothetical protein
MEAKQNVKELTEKEINTKEENIQEKIENNKIIFCV